MGERGGWWSAMAVVAMVAASGCRSWWVDEAAIARHAATLPNLDVAVVGAPVPASAALADYVDLALRRNGALRAAAHRWRAALERVPQVTALPDPRLEYVGFLEPIETRTGPQRHQVMLMQMVPWPGKLARQGDIASAAAEAAWWHVEARRRGVVRDVVAAWHEYGNLGHAITLVEAHLALLRRLEPVVQQRIRAGGRQDDLLRLQVEVGRVENELATLRARVPALSQQLAAVCNTRPDAPLPLPLLPEPALEMPDGAALAARLDAHNPELAALRSAVTVAEHRSALADLGPVPDVTLGLTWLVTGQARMRGTSGSGDDPLGVRVGVNLPLQAGRYGGAMREARAAAAAADDDLADRGHALRAAVALHAFRLEDATRQIGLYRDTLLPRARQGLQLAETVYRTGSGDLLGVIDSERMLLTFERAYWRAIASYGQARAELVRLVGTTTATQE